MNLVGKLNAGPTAQSFVFGPFEPGTKIDSVGFGMFASSGDAHISAGVISSREDAGGSELLDINLGNLSAALVDVRFPVVYVCTEPTYIRVRNTPATSGINGFVALHVTQPVRQYAGSEILKSRSARSEGRPSGAPVPIL